ncbi:MAG TPA: putative LPS assembly protein LptD, partial [Gammaproteobacteria bacterium]|nr:putative LPS assembly protein LptD [Gammaproteobacteria bacterium]
MFHEKLAPVLSLLLTVFAAVAGRSAEAQQCLLEPDPVTRTASDLLLAANVGQGQTAAGQPTEPKQSGLSAMQSALGQAESEPFVISAGRIEVGNATGAIFSNNVEVTRGDQSIHGERAILDRRAQRVEVTGRVTYTDPKLNVFGQDADFDAANRRISFGQAGFEIPSRTAHGSAESIVISANDTMNLDSVMFTTCPAEDQAWVLHAASLSLDVDRGFGTARGVKLKFKGVPILYTPYFTFPISSKRKSGFLTPSIGQRDRTGLDISVPYYLNLKPNLDMTLDPHYLSKRGLQVESQFRYLLPHSSGELDVSYLPNDQVIDRPRSYLNLQHRT